MTGLWHRVGTEQPWAGRSFFGMLVTPQDGVLLVGHRDVWLSTDRGASWQPMGNVGAAMYRVGGSAVMLPTGAVLWMAGLWGDNKNDVWRSEDLGRTWVQATPAASWSPRRFPDAVVLPVNGSVLLIGGYDVAPLADVWISTNEGAAWTLQTDSAPWPARYAHQVVALSDDTVLLAAGSKYSTDVWRSDDRGVSWVEVTSTAAGVDRNSARMVVLSDDTVVLLGGNDDLSVKLDALWYSSDRGLTWVELPASSAGTRWSPRRAMGVVRLSDNTIMVAGGELEDTSKAADVWLSLPAGWQDSDCSVPRRFMCAAPPHTAAVSVALPAAAGSVEPANAASVVTAALVYAPPVPVLSLSSNVATPTPANVFLFNVTLSTAVTQLAAVDFVVHSAVFVTSATLTGSHASYALAVTVESGHCACPTGFTAVVTTNTRLCLRTTVIGTWAFVEEECAVDGVLLVSPATEALHGALISYLSANIDAAAAW